MNLLDLMIKIGVDDRASGEIDSIANEATGKFGGMASKMGGAAKAIGTTMVAVTGAALTGAAAIGKASVDSYAEYEQLAGGVEKLYGDAADTLKGYAQEAYRTSGMSANEYMNTATQFSASLINSLNGDTQKAAEITDVAMRAMSDNVNTFGSNAEDVQNAFIGMSRGNFTMLDNLKLGYAGTSEGMLKLINDSGVLGQTLTDTSQLAEVGFDKMIEAVQAVQEQQGIAGTTAKEAMGTIEGSVNMAKAAWSNLVAELAKPEADIGARIGEMITAVFGEDGEGGVVRNVLETVRNLGTNIAESIPQLMPQIIGAIQETVPLITSTINEILPPLLEALLQIFSAIAQELPTLIGSLVPIIVEMAPMIVDAGMQLFTGLVTALGDNADTLINGLIDCLEALIDSVIENAPKMLEAAGRLFMALLEALAKRGPELLGKLVELLGTAIRYILDHIPEILRAALDFFGTLITSLAQNGPKILFDLVQLLISMVGTIIANIPEILAAGIEFLGGFLSGLLQAVPEVLSWFAQLPMSILDALGDLGSWLLDTGSDIINGLWDGAISVGRDLVNWFANLPNNILRAIGDLGNLLWNAGHNILTGFWNGMIGVWNDLTGWIGGIGDWIADHKGPREYDLRLLVKNGGWIMDGLGSGMKKAFEGDIIPYVKSMAGEISDAMNMTSSYSMGGMGAGAVSGVGMGPSIVIQNMYVREEQDIHRVAREIDSLWAMESAGAIG